MQQSDDFGVVGNDSGWLAISHAVLSHIQGYSLSMGQMGTLLVLVGAALAVLQAVWVIVSTGRQRAKLLRSKAQSESRESQIASIKEQLRARWGDNAAEIGNFEDLPEYRSEPELDLLRAELSELLEQRGHDDWVATWAAFGREKAFNERVLADTEAEWRRLWTQGVPGLVGGVMALIGGLMTAFA